VARSWDEVDGKIAGALVYFGVVKELYALMVEEGTTEPALLSADD
jgi:hypothetical protein